MVYLIAWYEDEAVDVPVVEIVPPAVNVDAVPRVDADVPIGDDVAPLLDVVTFELINNGGI